MKPSFVDKVLWIKKGQGVAAAGRIPEDAKFFKDHFPGFPVLPGVLALEMLKETAERYLRVTKNQDDSRFALKQIRAVKFSAYLKPGDEWESHLEVVSESGHETQWNARLMHQGQVAVSARFILGERHLFQTEDTFLKAEERI